MRSGCSAIYEQVLDRSRLTASASRGGSLRLFSFGLDWRRKAQADRSWSRSLWRLFSFGLDRPRSLPVMKADRCGPTGLVRARSAPAGTGAGRLVMESEPLATVLVRPRSASELAGHEVGSMRTDWCRSGSIGAGRHRSWPTRHGVGASGDCSGSARSVSELPVMKSTNAERARARRVHCRRAAQRRKRIFIRCQLEPNVPARVAAC